MIWGRRLEEYAAPQKQQSRLGAVEERFSRGGGAPAGGGRRFSTVQPTGEVVGAPQVSGAVERERGERERQREGMAV